MIALEILGDRQFSGCLCGRVGVGRHAQVPSQTVEHRGSRREFNLKLVDASAKQEEPGEGDFCNIFYLILYSRIIIIQHVHIKITDEIVHISFFILSLGNRMGVLLIQPSQIGLAVFQELGICGK